MTVTMEQIKGLRDATGVSIMACKKALEETGGDFDAAVDLLRKKGAAKAAAKADREAGEGAVAVRVVGNKVGMVKLSCETDFMARSDDFSALMEKILDALFAGEISQTDREIEFVKEETLKLGENIQVGGLAILEGDSVGGYVHSNKKIGVIVSLNSGSEDMAKDVAMHAAATNPAVLSPDEVEEAAVQKEKEIWKDQLAAEGKPAEIMEKIMMGKEKKFREDSALIKQAFVKNPEQTIEQMLAAGGASVKAFVRFEV